MKRILITMLIAVAVLGSVRTSALADDDSSKAEHRRLFREGAKLWPIYCNTCHNARPGSEKAPYEWDHIMMHMRMLGNLPAENAQALLEYLKSGRE